jgi:uncharacterized membrane protein
MRMFLCRQLVARHPADRRIKPSQRDTLSLPTSESFPLTTEHNLHATAQIARHPIHPMLVPVPIVCFIGALLTDITYVITAEMMWANFSAWLITIGFIVGVLAAIAGLVDFLTNPLVRRRGAAWPHMIGNLAVLIISFFNMLVHTRDAWTSVYPTGLILSAIVVLILPITGWLGWGMVYREGVGVAK